jgi:hypothetical protein
MTVTSRRCPRRWLAEGSAQRYPHASQDRNSWRSRLSAATFTEPQWGHELSHDHEGGDTPPPRMLTGGLPSGKWGTAAGSDSLR